LTAPRRCGTLLGMPKTLTELTKDAAELPVSERLKLARILLDLSETTLQPAEEVQSAWDDEIERRLQELRSGKVQGVPLEEVKKKIEARFHSCDWNFIRKRIRSLPPKSSIKRIENRVWAGDFTGK